MPEATTRIPVTLVNGKRIRIEVTQLIPPVVSEQSGEQDVGYSRNDAQTESDVSSISHSFQDISHAIEGIAESLAATIDKISPNKTTVEFGLELEAEAGALTALIVKGSGKANLKVTMEWSK